MDRLETTLKWTAEIDRNPLFLIARPHGVDIALNDADQCHIVVVELVAAHHELDDLTGRDTDTVRVAENLCHACAPICL